MKIELTLTNILLIIAVILLIRIEACHDGHDSPMPVVKEELKTGHPDTTSVTNVYNYYSTAEKPSETIAAPKEAGSSVCDSVRIYKNTVTDSVTGVKVNVTDSVQGVRKSLSVTVDAKKLIIVRVDTLKKYIDTSKRFSIIGNIAINSALRVGVPVMFQYRRENQAFSAGFDPVRRDILVGFGVNF